MSENQVGFVSFFGGVDLNPLSFCSATEIFGSIVVWAIR